jgi:hypothetical protein
MIRDLVLQTNGIIGISHICSDISVDILLNMFEIFIKLQMGLFSVSDVRSEN